MIHVDDFVDDFIAAHNVKVEIRRVKR